MQASLKRVGKSKPQLHIQDDIQFHIGGQAKFGEAVVRILQQQDRNVVVQCLEGCLPASGVLQQDLVASTPQEIFHEFETFWSTYWLRGSYDDQCTDDSWEDLHRHIDQCPLPDIPLIDLGLDNPENWIKSIHDLKEGKAHGIDGWRHEELRLLPFCCIRDLCYAFQPILRVGLGPTMMLARTILLPKNSLVGSMNQVRPITILGVLYRLLGKIVFKAVSNVWSKHLPCTISGGLPSRGVKDLAFQQKLTVESAIADKRSIGGMSLDLQKAFNTFGRRPFIHLFQKLGIPAWLTIFWINCLSKMQRCPQHRKRLGSPIPSTTGIPEGDCLSVLGMIALSELFTFSIKSDFIVPYTYADNWAWHSLACRPHFAAFQQMLALTSMLRVLVDFCQVLAMVYQQRLEESIPICCSFSSKRTDPTSNIDISQGSW